ncbi:MAG: hypothetical protein AB1772_13330 [Candidatus Zixiibacteriota bacterium]
MYEKYCIGLMIDGNNEFAKVDKIITNLNALMEGRDIETYPDGSTFTPRYVLKGTEITVECHVIVNANVPDAVKRKIQGDGGNALHASQIMWLGGGNFSYEYMALRLTQHAKEHGCTKIWRTHINTDTTGDILVKFTDI